METNSEHINNLFKQKFEDFAPQPPERVWTGIESALDKGLVPVWYNAPAVKLIAILLGIAVFLAGYWLLNQPESGNRQKITSAYQNSSGVNTVIDSESNKNIYNTSSINKKQAGTNTLNRDNNSSNKKETTRTSATISTTRPSQDVSVSATLNNKTKSKNAVVPVTKNNKSPDLTLNNIHTNKDITGIPTIQPVSISFNNKVLISPLKFNNSNNGSKQFNPVKKQNGKWVLGFYFSPEFIFDPFDSLTIQNSYALKVEPTYYINSHWFIRPGIGLSYARDKGFVKADYESWDYLGSYEDVVDVTFDTTGNTITPIYHTQTREVYDSILHITISEKTNRYLYLQTSLVFGYHNHVNKFGWSVYAGPQVNFILAEKRDKPVQDDVLVINLEYNMAYRGSPQYGLKLGFGMDYAIAKKWLVTVEPEFNYFINGINGGDIYNTPLSGVGVRFGLIYTIK